MRLFRGPVFRISSVLSFIVGFAMLGALTFLPSYLQYVQGGSATSSGLRTLPIAMRRIISRVLEEENGVAHALR